MIAVSSTALWIGAVAGLGLGSIYALMALSFTVVVATTGLFHFSLGAFITLGTVFSYHLSRTLGWPLYVVVPLIIVGGAVLGVVTRLVAIAPLLRRSSHVVQAVLVATLALGLVSDGFTAVRFGADERRVEPYVSGSPIMIGDVPVRPVFLVMLAVLVVFVLSFETVMRTTQVGRILRASQEDSVAVELAGVRIYRVHNVVFALAGATAGLAGFLVAPVSYASPHVGTGLLLYGFAAMAIGGFGSLYGAVVGGLVVGLITNVLPVFYEPAVTRPVLFVVIVAILVLRPSGIFGKGAVREV